jgi:pSer/pThr/pTyr-binding forkhead associated (FHA) protein
MTRVTMRRRPSKLDGLEDTTVTSKADDPSAASAPEELQAIVVGSSILGIHPLPSSGRVTIGRYGGSGIAIEHESISRFHAVLHVGPPHLIEDQGSANGTSVEGVPIAPGQKTPIDLGTVIKVGTVVLVVQKRK